MQNTIQKFSQKLRLKMYPKFNSYDLVQTFGHKDLVQILVKNFVQKSFQKSGPSMILIQKCSAEFQFKFGTEKVLELSLKVFVKRIGQYFGSKIG